MIRDRSLCVYLMVGVRQFAQNSICFSFMALKTDMYEKKGLNGALSSGSCKHLIVWRG